jgi:hypothetical protein
MRIKIVEAKIIYSLLQMHFKALGAHSNQALEKKEKYSIQERIQ